MFLNDYISSFANGVPPEVYLMLLAIFCMGGLFVVVLKGIRVGGRYSLVLLLGEYIFLLFCSTVLFRDINMGERCCLRPFWSYERISKGINVAVLLPQIIMNVIAFMPVGFIGGCVFRKHSFGRVLLLGFALSLSIEIMQFLFQRGFAEFDDVYHNTLGAIIGYGLFSLCRIVWAHRSSVIRKY